MQILLTNDDGIHAPGLAALEKELRTLGDVCVVAPAVEQSGVGHSITFLNPLLVKDVFEGQRRRGWAVEGSPADCVKIGIFEFCPKRPDLVISGMNDGLNAGINVLYSGTVAAAIEGAFFGIPSIAVSVESDPHARLPRAAEFAVAVIRQLVEHPQSNVQLFNLNIPLAALEREPELKIVPMGLSRYGESYERRQDPRGRPYYWATNDPPPPKGVQQTDLTALADGFVTLTPMGFDLTLHAELPMMQGWQLSLTGKGDNP